MSNTNPMDTIAKARSMMICNDPFFGSLALQLKVVETKDIPTFATDGRSLFFNPEFAATLSKDEIMGLIKHEVLHCAMLHMTRRGDRDHKRWNIACDAVINPIIVRSGGKLPAGGVDLPNLADLSAEEAYSKLPPPQKIKCYVDFGSVLDAKAPGSDSNGGGGSDDSPGVGVKISQADAKALENQWKVNAKQAAEVAKKAGKLPGGLEAFVDSLTEPKVDWRTVLRRFIQKTITSDYSWTRPNRRYVAQGIYLPGPLKENTGPMVVVMDASGSCFTPEVQTEFASEVNSIFKDVRPAYVTVMYFDTRVTAIERFDHGQEIEFRPKGGGGTDFADVMEKIIEMPEKPLAVVFFTDCYTSSWGENPGVPVLWVKYGDWNGEVPFGEMVEVESTVAV